MLPEPGPPIVACMKTLFLEVDTESTWAVASIGPACLAAFLRKHGHETTFLRVGLEMDPGEVVRRVQEEAPGLLGLSLTTRQWLRGAAVVRSVRESVHVPVIAGGLHPTFSPEHVLSTPGFDYVCLGEGEEALLELVEAMEAGKPTDGIANIWKRGGIRPPLRPPLSPLDSAPFMARDLLDEQHGVVHMTTQRGCPFPCTYCAARMFNELYEDTAEYGRRRSHQNVLDELFHLRDTGTLAYVIFLDDTFTINRGWVREFCHVYRDALHVPFSLHARVETVNPGMIEFLASAGCAHITYGVESGSYRVRREIMQRPATNDRIREVFRWTRDAGIMVTANYIIGLPGETREDLEETLELATELPAYDFGYFVFYPYPGTQLFRVCRENGYLPVDYLERPANHRETILDLPTLTKADIAEFYDRFTSLRERLYLERNGFDPAGTIHVHERAEAG